MMNIYDVIWWIDLSITRGFLYGDYYNDDGKMSTINVECYTL